MLVGVGHSEACHFQKCRSQENEFQPQLASSRMKVEALASAPLFAKAGRKNVLTPYAKELLAECAVLLKSVEALDDLKKSCEC